MTITSRLMAALGTGTAVLLLVGCSGQGNAENHNAQAVATTFNRSVTSDPAAACALLAPQTLKSFEDSNGDCAKALADQVSPSQDAAGSVQVYGKDAIVHVGDETVFLARFPVGWRVTAAGCEPSPGRPYDCAMEGD